MAILSLMMVGNLPHASRMESCQLPGARFMSSPWFYPIPPELSPVLPGVKEVVPDNCE
jgi:hypothetical protein